MLSGNDSVEIVFVQIDDFRDKMERRKEEARIRLEAQKAARVEEAKRYEEKKKREAKKRLDEERLLEAEIQKMRKELEKQRIDTEKVKVCQEIPNKVECVFPMVVAMVVGGELGPKDHRKDAPALPSEIFYFLAIHTKRNYKKSSS